MKRKLICFLFSQFLFLCLLNAQSLSASIVFEERVFDFGTILEKDGSISHTFVFQNKGNSPVTIDEVNSGCGCIGTSLSKEPVKPGEKGKINITFNPEYKTGFFSKEIVVFSNNYENFNRIWVEGKIIPSEHPIEDDYPYNFGEGLYLKLKVMAFGYLKPGMNKQMELQYANDTNEEMTLNFEMASNKGGLKFKNPGKIAPKARGTVNFSYNMPYLTTDDVVLQLNPYVNNKKLQEVLEIKILNENKYNRSKQIKSEKNQY